jgi:hypothetical protein
VVLRGIPAQGVTAHTWCHPIRTLIISYPAQAQRVPLQV